jgi:hypothetical protein
MIVWKVKLTHLTYDALQERKKESHRDLSKFCERQASEALFLTYSPELTELQAALENKLFIGSFRENEAFVETIECIGNAYEPVMEESKTK